MDLSLSVNLFLLVKRFSPHLECEIVFVVSCLAFRFIASHSSYRIAITVKNLSFVGAMNAWETAPVQYCTEGNDREKEGEDDEQHLTCVPRGTRDSAKVFVRHVSY